MEMMPQAIPNMVRSVRRLCAQSVASVSRSRSRKDTVRSYCRTTCCFSFRPARISVFTPLEIPV